MNIAVPLLFSVVVCSSFLRSSTSYEYCLNNMEKELCHGEKHLVCDPTVLERGGDLQRLVPTTKKIRNTFVELHNAYRNNTACGAIKDKSGKNYPKASRMRSLKWDYELAYTAGIHAQRCRVMSDKCRNTDRFRVSGQSAYRGYATADHRAMGILYDGVTVWYNGHKAIQDGVPAANLYPTENVDDVAWARSFTTMMNDRVSHVGCAVAYCKDYDTNNFTYHVTCHYDYGNMRYELVYLTGDPQSKCDDWEAEPHSEYECLCTGN